MPISRSTKFAALVGVVFLIFASLAFGDNTTVDSSSDSGTATVQTAVADNSQSSQTKQTEVVVLTDPELAAVVDEEPDCE